MSFLTAIDCYENWIEWKSESFVWRQLWVNALNGNIIMWSVIAWLLQSTQCIILPLTQTICSQVIGLGHDSQHRLTLYVMTCNTFKAFHSDFSLFFSLFLSTPITLRLHPLIVFKSFQMSYQTSIQLLLLFGHYIV